MLWLLVGLGFFFFVALLVPVYITIRYDRLGEQDDFAVVFQVLGVIRFQFRVPVIDALWAHFPANIRALFEMEGPIGQELKVEEKVTPSGIFDQWASVTKSLKSFQWVFGLLYVFLEGKTAEARRYPLGIPALGLTAALAIAVSRHCTKFTWHTRFGTPDAAVTGAVSGILWAFKGVVLGFLEPHIRFYTVPDILVIPDFQEQKIGVHLHCIFKVHVGHIIIVGLSNLVKVGILKGVKALGQ